MISVIVPVYKTEQYLKECLDSLVNQTYRDLDVILIDDESPDQCPEICDEYAALYPFMRVFHIPSTGVSGARNYGIERAKEKKPEYIYFLDSDDWLEYDMLEKLYDAAVSNSADIAVCGWNIEYKNSFKSFSFSDNVYDKDQAMKATLNGFFQYSIWNKLWRITLLEGIYFPLNTYFEDVRTMYKLFENADKVVTISTTGYHYRQRNNSIVHFCSVKPLIDRWKAAEELYHYFESGLFRTDAQIRQVRLDYCAYAAIKLWSDFKNCSPEERREAKTEMKSIASFIRNLFPFFGLNKWSLKRRLLMILTRRAIKTHYFIAYLLKWKERKNKNLYVLYE